jgi:hypothetical protein
VDRRAELKRQAREAKPEAGVYRIRNARDGKALVESTLNLRSLNGVRMFLARGEHRNERLRADLAALGPDSFVVEVLEVLPEDEGLVWRRDALARLEAAWLERLQPYGERGYNAPPRGRSGRAGPGSTR